MTKYKPEQRNTFNLGLSTFLLIIAINEIIDSFTSPFVWEKTLVWSLLAALWVWNIIAESKKCPNHVLTPLAKENDYFCTNCEVHSTVTVNTKSL